MSKFRQAPVLAIFTGLALATVSFSASAMFCGKSGYGKKYPHPYAMNYPYGYGYYTPAYPVYGYHGHHHPHAQYQTQQGDQAAGKNPQQKQPRSY